MVLPTNEKQNRDREVKNILIYGEPFSGKTTMASGLFDDTLIVSTDNNYLHLDTPAMVVRDFNELFKTLEELEKDTTFKCVIFDLVEDMLEMTRVATLKKMGIDYEGDVDYGSAWHQTGRSQEAILLKMASLPHKVIFIAHASSVTTKSRVGVEEVHIIPKIRAKYLDKLVGYTQLSIKAFKEDGEYFVQTQGDKYTSSRGELGLEKIVEQNKLKEQLNNGK